MAVMGRVAGVCGISQPPRLHLGNHSRGRCGRLGWILWRVWCVGLQSRALGRAISAQGETGMVQTLDDREQGSARRRREAAQCGTDRGCSVRCSSQ